MTKKIKVPRWFDRWAVDVGQEYGDNHFTCRGNGVKEVLVSKILLQGIGKNFSDDPGCFPKCSGYTPYAEKEYFTAERALYVARNKFDLIKAIIDGYEVEEQKGYVKLDRTKDIHGNVLYAAIAESNGRWCVSVRKYSITRSRYDNAPAWVKACKFTPVESEGED